MRGNGAGYVIIVFCIGLVSCIENGARYNIQRIASGGCFPQVLNGCLQLVPVGCVTGIESVCLRRHVGEVVRLVHLINGRPPVVGRHLMAAGVASAVTGGQLWLPGLVQGRVVLPTVATRDIPGIRRSVHRKCRPERRLLGFVIKHSIIAQNHAVILEGMHYHLLIGIARNIEPIPIGDLIAPAEVHFRPRSRSPGHSHGGHLS